MHLGLLLDLPRGFPQLMLGYRRANTHLNIGDRCRRLHRRTRMRRLLHPFSNQHEFHPFFKARRCRGCRMHCPLDRRSHCPLEPNALRATVARSNVTFRFHRSLHRQFAIDERVHPRRKLSTVGHRELTFLLRYSARSIGSLVLTSSATGDSLDVSGMIPSSRA